MHSACSGISHKQCHAVVRQQPHLCALEGLATEGALHGDLNGVGLFAMRSLQRAPHAGRVGVQRASQPHTVSHFIFMRPSSAMMPCTGSTALVTATRQIIEPCACTQRVLQPIRSQRPVQALLYRRRLKPPAAEPGSRDQGPQAGTLPPCAAACMRARARACVCVCVCVCARACATA